MNGFGFRAHGGVERLEFVEVPEPRPAAGEIRVRVARAALNHLDRFVLAGIPGVPIDLPHILGSDAAGWVDALGEGLEGPAVGTRVLVNPGLWDGTCEACRAGSEQLCRAYRILGEHVQGSLAPYLTVPARNVHPIPASLSFDAAAAAPLVFQTAWRALMTVGELKAGETLAIVGAGGGVATSALKVGQLAGARVAVVSRSSEKLERARGLGAETLWLRDGAEPLDRLLWEWSGKKGVDVIFDSVGQPTLSRSVRALARGGRAVVIGATAGPLVEIDVRTLFWRQASIRGSTMASRREFDQVFDHLIHGRLSPVVDGIFDFADAGVAFRRLESPDLFGKVVVRVSEEPR